MDSQLSPPALRGHAVEVSDATAQPTRPPLPEWLHLAPGRSVLWRSADSVQLGLADPHAMVLEGLTAPLATLLSSMDGTRSTARLVADAVAAGAADAEVRAVLGDLVGAGLAAETADPAGRTATEHTVDEHAWSVHSARRCDELVQQRRGATVVIDGSTRLALALATSLASAGVGRVVVDPAGTVQPADVGTGYQLSDVGKPRAVAAREALRRTAPTVVVPPPTRYRPDLVVLADALVPDPDVVRDLVSRQVPHLAAHAHEGVAVVGPLVLPGRSSCLRCVQLHRGDQDPAWPKLAAQLVDAVPVADLGCAQVAAALATEQVLAVLAGPSGSVGCPPTWGASLELDPLRGRLRHRSWPPHPYCPCGAAGGGSGRARRAGSEPVCEVGSAHGRIRA